MSIKSIVWSNENSPPKPYPKLMGNEHSVVLFRDRYNGVIVHSYADSDKGYAIGADVNSIQGFKDYGGSITLENT